MNKDEQRRLYEAERERRRLQDEADRIAEDERWPSVEPGPITDEGDALAAGMPASGRALRDESMRLVDEHADEEWKLHADAAIEHVARAQRELTTDDVWARLAVAAPGSETRERRAMGPRMLAASRAGWIVKTNRVRESSRAVCHLSPKTVWSSRLIA
jgi:hypothetical protein